MTHDDRTTLNEESLNAWRANAAYWDRRMGDEGNDFHREIVAPATLDLLDLKRDERVCDAGCGNGLFARRLVGLGMQVFAFDGSVEMIDAARARSADPAGRISYEVIDATDAESLNALGEGRFDAVVSNMVVMDIPVLAPLFEAVRRALVPGTGRFVFSLCHPCFQSPGVRRVVEEHEEGDGLHQTHSLRVSRYLEPAVTEGIAVVGQPAPQHYFHRPLHALLDEAFAAGFVVTGLAEPAPPPIDGQRLLSWDHLAEIPPALIVRLGPR